MPKGAMLTHFNIVANAHQIASWDVKASDKDVYLGALPPESLALQGGDGRKGL